MENIDEITLVSKDNKKLKVSRKICHMSAVLSDAVEELNSDEAITVPCYMVHSTQLSLIIEYCKHYNFERDNDNIPMPVPKGDKSKWITDPWELQFINALSTEELMELLLACNYLNVPALFELCCASVASIFKGQSFSKKKKDIIVNPDPQAE